VPVDLFLLLIIILQQTLFLRTPVAGASVPPLPRRQFQMWHETSEGHACSRARPPSATHHLRGAGLGRGGGGGRGGEGGEKSLGCQQSASPCKANQLPLSSPNWNGSHQPAKERRKVLELYVLSLAFILLQFLSYLPPIDLYL